MSYQDIKELVVTFRFENLHQTSILQTEILMTKMTTMTKNWLLQIPWDNNHDALAKWANATTGFPWIDAIMTQLREEVEMIT